jgi:hypothetical protein
MMAATIIPIPKPPSRRGKAKVVCITSKFKPLGGLGLPDSLDQQDPEPPKAA